MDDSELSRLLGLLSDRTALTGEYPNPLATNAKADHISSEEGARDVSQQTLSGSTTKLGKDTSKWYRDCPPDEEILVLGQFAEQIATERVWEHNRQVQFAKSKYKPTDPKKGDTAPSISSTITFQLDEVGPREWQHIPGRDIAMWDRDAVQGSLYSPQLDCASKLLQLKPGTLRYEPIDVEKFVSGIRNFLREQGIFVPSSLSQSTGKWTLAAFRASLVLLAFGVQLQSAVILHELSFLWLETKVTDITIPSEDSVVLEMALKGLSTFPDGAACRLALPVSRCIIGSWITEVYRPSVRDAIACDGRFLYIYGRLGLLKIGTGAGDTLRNMVYSHCRTYCRAADVERSWLCLIGDSLYCRTITMPGHCVDRISLDFQTITPLLLGSSSTTGVSSTSVYAMVTDGTSLYTISCRDQLAFLKTPAPPMLQRSKAKRKEKTAAISALEANPIQVGNRVVRGPDWKWSNQDGEPGSVGTVERISTWGGVQGSGITVRWDKNQRMNTYRWGAEGCFDIQIVEEDASGNIVAQRPLKRDTTKPNGSPSRSLHQFVVCRYDPSQLSSYLDLPDESLHGLLNIASKVDCSVDPDAKPQLTKVHEHPVGESTLTTSWICDGQQAGCLGPSVPRYRCLEGCDYDLCASCFAATAKQDEQTSKSVDLLELPFAHEDDTFFQSEDDSVASEQEQQSRIAKLEEAWNGQYNYRECAVALLKHDNDVQKANEWLAASGALLKKRCIIPVCDSVLLEQNNMSFLDPVLLIAGSFYTTGSQLGIVVPFGICHIEATPRRRRNGDVLCVFSMATGTLLSDFNQVITIADIPAGSPMCYDASRDRLIGYSTTSQVLMEFSNMEYATPLNQTTEVPGLENPGGALLYHLTRIMGLRHLLSPIHFPVKTIEMQLQAIDTGKTKRRQIKKLHARLEMMKAFPDPKQGYFLPFCVDVQSLPSLSKALRHAVHFRWKVEYISQVLYLLVGLLEEAMPAGVVDFGSLESDVESLETLLVHLSRGEYCDQDIGVVARLAQRALLWGMIHQHFLQSSLKLRSSVRAWCSTIDVSIENASFLVLMPLSHPSRMYSNASQAKIGFVGSVLRTLASSTIFLDRLAEDPQEWIESIFDLSDKESKVLKQDEVSLSPSQRLFISIEPEDELTSLSFLANWNPIAQEIREIAQDVNHPLISQLEKQFGPVFIGVSKIEIKCADSSEMKPIIEHLMRLQRYLMRQTQIENEWFYFITEDTNLDSVRDRLAENEELLHDLCVLQDIPVANTDQLIRKLEEAKASGGAISRSSTVRLVGELASLLLKRTNLFRSRINPTDIDKTIVQHQERGNQRLTGLKMLSRLLSLKSVSTRQYFLGILVSALKERKTRVSILDNCRLCDSDLALQLHQEAQSLMMKMKGYLEAPETLFSHKVLLAIDLTIIESSKMSESLFLQVAQLLQQTPTVKLTTESALGFPRPLSVQEERTRRLNAFDDILWMTFRRFLWENDVSLSLRMDACYTLFEHSRNASKKSRILNLVHSLSVQSQTLSEKWISAVTSIVVEFTQPPQVLRPAIRLLHTLEAPHDFGLIRRMLFGIGQCLLLVSDTTRSIDEDYATVLLYSSSCNEDLMKLVNELDTQLKPEISSWGLSLDANTFEKQQILMLDTSMVHRYVQCDGCGMNPLVGYRFKCQSCSNYDLCTACYVGKVHDMEHVFLRCSDSTGSGDQLPPRSTETLVGSRLWKTGLLQSELQSKGYVVVLTSSEHECKTLAEKISSLSLSSTVLGIAQVRRMQSLHLDKEGANLRNSHATALNAKASPCDFYLVKQELSSLYTSLVRKWLQIKPQAVSAISASFKLVPKLFANCQSTSEVYEGIGALAIMGGAVEPLIENGHVKWENTTAIVREVFPQHVNLELANGRFEYDVKRSAVRPVSRTDLNPYLASLFLDLLNVFQQSLEGVLNWLKSDEICLVKSDLSWRLLKALEVLIPLWPSMSDNQVLAMYGNAPSNLMQLAQKSIAHGVFTQETDRTRRMVWELSRNMHTFLALGPTTGQSPVLNVLNDFTKLQQADDYQESTYWYNLYAYASMSDLPQDPGRNKLLDYWERHVIPAIQKYVRGSFKSYEMDYFFAQLREPLREGNNTAARRIAHTLCDGHVPPGCNFPEADTDWSALQWDDLEIGGCYRIALDTASSPTAMQWCDGQIGHVALIDPSTKLTLLQVVNPNSSCLEHWWLPVSQLQPGGSANPSITKYTTELYPNLQRSLVFDALQSARQCIFSMIRQCPELLTLESNTPQPGFALSSVLQICADQWSPLEMRKEHPVKDALHCQQSMIHPSREPSQKLSKKSKVLQNTAAPKEVLMKSIGGLVLSAITQAIQLHDSYVVTSTSPPEPLVRLHIPDASWMVLTFFVHPVLMDLPAGSGMEIFYDEDCTQLIRGYYGGRKGLNKLPPVWVTANTCYIKMSAAQYARYKFRVGGINRALGIATWLHDFMNDSYHWCSFLEQGNWPPLIQQVAFNALIPKMPRSLSPILSSKLKEQWQVVYAEENPVFSTYAQQLMEVMSLIQDNSAPIISPFRRMTKFAEAFTDPTKEGVVGRVPLEEIKTIVEKTQLCDYFIQRLIIVQRLPKTLDQDGLTRGISKWIVHLSLECCGEADDQSIFSATEVTRFGILANVLYCPVDENGYTRGFCIVDVGRDDIIDKLMTSLARNPFFFEGEHTEDDPVLMAYINQSENITSAHQAEPTTWKCGACTLENSSESVVCSICEAPRPDRPPTTDNTESAVDGWTCGACTFLNSWGNPSCSVCDMPCDKERPTQANSDASSQDKEKSETPPSDANQHTLSVLKFKDAFDAGHDRDPRINEFLQSVLAPNTGDLGKLPQCPREMYLEIRSRGLDFQLTRSHFTSMENAIASMDKWTVAMDVQLIEMTRLRCHEVGMLNLTDLSPSHLLSVNPQFSLLVSLPLQEIRLRFLILQQWNILLCETLSLVDFHHLGTKLVALRKLIFPGVKIRFFNLVQDNMTQSGEKKPNVVLDRIKWKRDPTVSLFEVARKQLQAVNPLTFRVKRPLGASDPFIAFSVVFQGENVVGEGGPYRQLFSDLAHECIRLRIFQPTPNASLRIGEYRDMLIPRPSALSRLELEQYEFIGLLMGCCLRTGVHLPLRIAPIIWKCLVQQPLTLIDLKQIDQSLHDSLLCLQSDPNLLESLTFTTSLSDGTFVELVKDGADKVVTKANLSEYIRLVQQVRLNECKPQVDAMLQGISKIVPLPLLPLCTWTELQQWVCGSQAIDIELLKRHTKYSAGMTVDKNPHLEYFWRALASFSDDDRRRFINFAWGQESLPADDAEFDRTRTRLLIKPPPATDKSQDSLLPKADTCFFNIELPAYSSLSTMKEKLLLAINLCTSMDADDQTARMDVFFDEE
ncbi:hypothetical protein Ae201684P_014881 [Aphanomyces euteiches]|nr:hypothetical protein Ae201684P_014881 [Aphanomyces euteiches]